MCFAVGNITIFGLNCGFRNTFQILFYTENRMFTSQTKRILSTYLRRGIENNHNLWWNRLHTVQWGRLDVIFKYKNYFYQKNWIFKTLFMEYSKWNIYTDIKKNAFVYYSINSRQPCSLVELFYGNNSFIL